MNDAPKAGRPRGGDRPDFDPQQEAPLLSAYVDGELDPDQVARVEAHLARDPASRREVERLRRLKEVTDSMQLREAPPEAWERFWENIYNRTERGLGWFALTLGAVIVGGYGLYELCRALLFDSGVPLLLRIGIFAGCFGVLLLTVSVIRERIFVRKRTRYKDVIR